MKKHFSLLAAVAMFFGCNADEQAGFPATGSHPTEIQTVLNVGQPAPEIAAAGWLNASPPGSSELEGKVVVVDVWAHW